jgi:hypothetical protein
MQLGGYKPWMSNATYFRMLEFVRARHDLEKLRSKFENDGYVIIKPEIPEDVLAGAAAFTEHVYQKCIKKVLPEDFTGECRNLHQDKYTHKTAVRELAQNYHIRAVLAALHEHEPFPFQTLNYPCTSLARTHSDYVHFAAQPLPLMSAAWVALIDVDPKAGPVFYYPGSHRLDHYDMQDFGLDRRQDGPLNYAKYQDIMTAIMERSGLKRELAVIPRGYCLIWTANLVHGGPPATIGDDGWARRRLSQVTHYFFHGSAYQWAPVASDVVENQIEYYDPASVLMKWQQGDQATPDERARMSKFRSGTCNEIPSGIPSPCAIVHRPPKVLSSVIQHNTQPGESVM